MWPIPSRKGDVRGDTAKFLNQLTVIVEEVNPVEMARIVNQVPLILQIARLEASLRREGGGERIQEPIP